MAPTVTYSPLYANRDGTATAPSSAMLLKYYSPSVELRLLRGEAAKVMAAQQAGKKVCVMIEDEWQAHFTALGVTVAPLGAVADLAQIAQILFAQMRVLERAGVDLILTHTFAQGGLGAVLQDRLIRATEGKVIEVG